MRFLVAVTVFLTAGCLGSGGASYEETVAADGFDAHAPDAPPSGFETHEGQWRVQQSLSARSEPQVLYQGRGTSGYAYAVADAQVPADAAIEASLRITGGVHEREAGIVFRWQDAENHYAFNIDANEGGMRFTRVADGLRDDLVLDRTVQYQMYGWYHLRVEADGDGFTAFVDGEQVLEVEDPTHAAGKAGLFTKRDALADFDDFRVLA